MDEMLERLLGTPRTVPAGTILPIDVLEQDGRLVVKAAIPGVTPEELDIQIDNNVLTIKGEHKQEQVSEHAKVYRREVAYGAFSRAIRLPENLQLDQVDAEFRHGVVTISIPKIEEPKPQPIKVNVRAGESS